MAAAEPDYDAEMKLPAGMRCDDCAHAQRCFGFGFSSPGRTSCDFWPNRFLQNAQLVEAAPLSAPQGNSGRTP